jgi:hypothetical protein
MEDLIQVVRADLSHLATELHESVDDDALRRSSTILRRLLVEGDLQRAWRASGHADRLLIRAPTLEYIQSAIPQQKVVLAAAGGSRFKGLAMMGFLEASYVLPKEDLDRLHGKGIPTRELPAEQYVASPSMIVKGVAISRRLIIKYVANKLGGAHFDPKRRPDKEKVPFELLDHVRATYVLAGKNAVYFELLAIGQSTTNSGQLREWVGLPPAEGPFAAAP